MTKISSWRWFGASTITFLWITGWGMACDYASHGPSSLGYYMHLAVGQAKLFWRRKPIERVLNDPTISDSIKSKLRIVQSIRTFAFDTMSLKGKHHYRYYVDINRPYVAYAVTAASKTSLTPFLWRFPLIGAVPYKGFFSLEKAQVEGDAFNSEECDVLLRGVPAYSAGKWLSDPIYSTLLQLPVYSLVNTILHELAHSTIYINGNARFNENFATFVGYQGMLEFLTTRYGKNSRQVTIAQDAYHDKTLFSQFIDVCYRLMDDFYHSASLTDRERIAGRGEKFNECTAIFNTQFRPKMKTEQFDYIQNLQLNNTILLSFSRYSGSLKTFQDRYAMLNNSWPKFIAFYKANQDIKLGGADGKTVHINTGNDRPHATD